MRYLIILILSLPIVFGYVGSDSFVYDVGNCKYYTLLISGQQPIDDGEFSVLSECSESNDYEYRCNCSGKLNISFALNAVNNYSIEINMYREKEENSGGGGGGGSRRKTTPTPTPSVTPTPYKKFFISNYNPVVEAKSVNSPKPEPTSNSSAIEPTPSPTTVPTPEPEVIKQNNNIAWLIGGTIVIVIIGIIIIIGIINNRTGEL